MAVSPTAILATRRLGSVRSRGRRGRRRGRAFAGPWRRPGRGSTQPSSTDLIAV